jgi:hypothetical protein
MSRLTTSFKRVGEQIATIPSYAIGIIPDWGIFTWNGLRSSFKVLASRFWGVQPTFDNTIVNYDMARQLYRNDGNDSKLGSGFCKPIIDLAVDFVGQPYATTDDEELTDFLNTCLKDYWGSAIREMFRNSMRDSKTILRLRQPDINDPLMTMEERSYGHVETIEPERCVIQFQEDNKNVITQAYITRRMLITESEIDVLSNVMPFEREHEIMEIITQDSFTYWDKTDMRWMDELAQPNSFGIVPLVEVYNEYDSSLSGGQSDLESVYPFVMALHDVMAQSLMAHKYHSTPKIKFKLSEVGTFIKNNFPDAWDENTGRLIPNSTLSWDSKSVVFLQSDEDAGFIEAKSVLNDSRELMQFLIDCICVASETPRWAFMLVEAGSANQANNAQTLPFVKKIERKRAQYVKPLQKILKMVQHINGYQLQVPTITWDVQHPEQLATWAQAFQFFIMSLEVMAQRQIISDDTYREIVSQYLPQMERPDQEAQDATKNFDAAAALAQTQDAPKNAPTRGTNGRGDPRNIPITPISSVPGQGQNE